jgi:energy-coupling factor transporter transmembrane protein EcfT
MYRTGNFVTGQSIIHRLDPRLKMAAVCLLSVMILAVHPAAVLVIALALSGAVLASRIRFRTIGQAVKPLLFFIGLIFFAHAFSGESGARVAIPYAGISLSPSGMAEGCAVTLKFLCLITTAVILTMTTTPSRMIAAIKSILKPLKRMRLPVDDGAVMIMIALRLMPLLLAEKERVETAQKARGYDRRRASWINRFKAFLSLTTTVLLGVFRRADELAAAMEARGYDRGERTTFIELKMGTRDYAGFAILLLFSAGVLIIHAQVLAS